MERLSSGDRCDEERKLVVWSMVVFALRTYTGPFLQHSVDIDRGRGRRVKEGERGWEGVRKGGRERESESCCEEKRMSDDVT
jgi:hypothetical protein